MNVIILIKRYLNSQTDMFENRFRFEEFLKEFCVETPFYLLITPTKNV